jgi:hypothetical protein
VNEARRAVLMDMYRAFNARDAEAATSRMAPEVDWPNEATGGRERGPSAVRRSFKKEWRETDPRVEPTAIVFDGDGKAHVRVHELIRTPAGDILKDRKIEHVFSFEGPFISRLDVVEADPDPAAEEDDEEEGAWS